LKLRKHNYETLAASRGLIHLEDTIPLNAKEKAHWQCLSCGAVYAKSYRVVANHPTGCICQSGKTTPPEKYYSLAEKWNLTWLRGEYIPINCKVQQRWAKSDGTIFEASYWELAYDGKMPNRIKKVLGLPYREHGGRKEVVHA